MDEEQSTTLLAPSSEALASIKVFPLILSIKRDIVVSALASRPMFAARVLIELSSRI